jgi:transcriptional regulator NrdR family protein
MLSMSDGIRCPNCEGSDRSVISSRKSTDRVVRRCQCDDCGNRYTTKELLADEEAMRSNLIEPAAVKRAAKLLQIVSQLQADLEDYLSAVERL